MSVEGKSVFITQSSGPSTPANRKKETKAQYLWRLLRLTLRDTVKAVFATENITQKVVHGMSHVRSISPNLADNVEYIFDGALNPARKEGILIDANCAYIVNWAGRLLRVVLFDKPNAYHRILFCHSSAQFITWKPGDDALTLLDGEANVVNSTVADIPVYSVLYNPYRSELIVGHCGGTSTWQFRYNNQYLVQNRHVSFRSFPSEKFEFLSIEATSSRSQRAFAASFRLVVIFCLETGQVTDYKRNLHLTEITAILYFNPLKLLVTAAKDGTIKAWNPDWTVQRVLVGHAGPILYLQFYPFGASFISCGSDHTLRLWCLDAPGQLNSITVQAPLIKCETVRGEDSFISVSSTGNVDLWRAHDLHVLQTGGGGGYQKLLCTTTPFWPKRAIAMCGDGCIRAISTSTGTVVSTALPPNLIQHGTKHHVYELVDIAYSAFDDTVFGTYDNGDFAKFSFKTNPASISFVKHIYEYDERITALAIYENIGNPWARERETEIALGNLDSVGKLSLKFSGRLNRCLLFAGRRDGKVCCLDWQTGDVQYTADAHLSDGGVCCMATAEKEDILVTAGHDQIIRIWKIYSFSIDPLSVMSSFFCSQLPKPLCTMRKNFSAALQHPGSATFALVTYDFDVNARKLLLEALSNQTSNRADHSPLDDHTDEIVGISYCQKLGLMASAASDGTVRIWDDFNRPLRILELNGLPHSVAFCGQNGDLLVGIGDNLHFISHENYLPMPYKVKLMTIPTKASPEEKEIPLDEEVTKTLSKKAMKLLSGATAASRYTRFDDPVPEDEQKELDLELEHRNKAYELLAHQDAEITRVANGEEETKRLLPKLTPAAKKSAFDRYLDFFYHRPDTTAVDLDAMVKPESPKAEEEFPVIEAKVPKYHPPPEPSSFFARQRHKCSKPNWIIDPAAYIPNSVLAKLLFPPPAPDEKVKEWRPPGLTEEQLAFLMAHNAGKQVIRRKIGQDDERSFTWYDEEEDSAYKQALLDVVNAEPPEPTPPPPPPEEENKTEIKIRHSEYLSRKLQPQRQMKKFVRIVEPTREPTPVKIPTPPPPPTPIRHQTPEIELPDYIIQFVGQPWFDHFFPNPTPKTFPVKPPYSVIKFTDYMLKIIGKAPWHLMSGLLDSFLILYRQFGTDSCHPDSVKKTLLRMFDSEAHPININEKDHREFIYACAHALVTLNLLDTLVTLEFISFYMIGDDFTRELMLQEFCMAGLVDPKNYFGIEMDSWDPAGGKVEGMTGAQQLRRRREFRKIASDWLARWVARFRRHLDRAVARLLKGQAVVAAGKRPQGARSSRRPATILPALNNQGDTQLQRTMETMQVSINAAPNVAKMPISAIEAINYFCDEMAERDSQQVEKVEEGDRNAVVAPVLPEAKLSEVNIRLPRIGAMRYNSCRPERESLCYLDSRFSTKATTKTSGSVYLEEENDPLKFTATHLRLPTSVVSIEGPNNIGLTSVSEAIKPVRPQDKVRALLEKNQSSFILLTLRTAPKYFYLPPPCQMEEQLEIDI